MFIAFSTLCKKKKMPTHMVWFIHHTAFLEHCLKEESIFRHCYTVKVIQSGFFMLRLHITGRGRHLHRVLFSLLVCCGLVQQIIFQSISLRALDSLRLTLACWSTRCWLWKLQWWTDSLRTLHSQVWFAVLGFVLLYLFQCDIPNLN